MSHLETATLGIENGQAINVPTSGVEGSTDPREILKILLGRGWTPLPFPSEKAAVDAAGKASKAWDHKPQQESKGMNPLESIFQMLSQPAIDPQQLYGENQAQKELESQGSVMAKKPYQPGPLGIPGDVISSILQQINPLEWMGGGAGMAGASAGGRMAKTFKPAAQEAASYTDRLLGALKSYANPVELMKAKGRLQPALQIAKGEPNLATNLMVGQGSTGHGPLYEALQGMPSAQMQHGYFDPSHQVFLDDALNTLLFDPDKLKTATKLLGKGMSLDSIIAALGYTRP